MAIFNKIAIIAIFVWVDMVINMVNNGKMNVKADWKNLHWLKSYGQNKKNVKNGPKMVDFICILGQKLKLMATAL